MFDMALLDDLVSRAGHLVADVYGSARLSLASDDELLETADAAGHLLRLAEAMLAEAAGEMAARSDSPVSAERLTTRRGCRSPRELVARVARVSERRAGEIVLTGRATARTEAGWSGERLPARYPALREALSGGEVGVDGVVAVATVLDAADLTREQRAAADEELAASARGDGVDGGGVPAADDLRLQAQVWATVLDPDGAEPREAAAMRRRGLILGVCRNGLVPIRGMLLPEVAGQLQRTFDAILNPAAAAANGPAPTAEGRAAGGPVFLDASASSRTPDDARASASGDDTPPREPKDPRSPAQRRHDALATVVGVAARSGALPVLGGAAPTLLVSVRHDDVARGRGVAHIDGIAEPVSLSVARHVACTGAVQRVVLGGNGRIERIETPDRVFGPHQRRAVVLRDGECIIPGCHVPAPWCEIHHVTEAARGGPTHTGNGVLLCWHHHRTLDTGGWHIRMRNGIPEVRGPAWWDARQRWIAVTKSPTRRHDRFGGLREARRL